MSANLDKGKIIQILLAVLVLLAIFYFATRGDDAADAQPQVEEPKVVEEVKEPEPEPEPEPAPATTTEEMSSGDEDKAGKTSDGAYADMSIFEEKPTPKPMPVVTETVAPTLDKDTEVIAVAIAGLTDEEMLERLKPLLVMIIEQLEQLVQDLIAYRDRVYKERGITL
jgi:hypothetical protein